MAEESQGQSEALEAALARRIELKSAVSETEIAAASPIRQAGWLDRLLEALDGLRIAMDQHVTEVEDDGGLLSEIVHVDPQMAPRVDHLQADHPVLQQQIADAIAQAKEQGDPSEIRSTVVDILFEIVRHRQRGADLVYETYSVDFGGG